MPVIDDVLERNRFYALGHVPGVLSPRPRKHLAILTCMDTRLTLAAMGLNEGDAHIVRNAGAVVTDDAVRSLLVSHHLLGTEEFMIIGHTDCGLNKTTDEELTRQLDARFGPSHAPVAFHAFRDVEAHIRAQFDKLRAHPWLAPEVTIRAFIFDVQTGRLRELAAAL